jgi:hypothetical protein
LRLIRPISFNMSTLQIVSNHLTPRRKWPSFLLQFSVNCISKYTALLHVKHDDKTGNRATVATTAHRSTAELLSSGRVGGGAPIRGSQSPLLALPRRKVTHCADKLLRALRTS